jgi:MurNAc alpha-1-phosphate uridylyltransferase
MCDRKPLLRGAERRRHNDLEQLWLGVTASQGIDILIGDGVGARTDLLDERRELLGTAGGVIKALPELGDGPFYHVNSDTIWIDGVTSNLGGLASAFDRARMDALLLVAPTTSSIGYVGRGDFLMAPDGRLARRAEREIVPFVYAGAAILTPAFLTGAPQGPASMSPFFDRSAQAGRLFGLRLEGVWMHVGTPDAVKAAEAAILASAVEPR